MTVQDQAGKKRQSVTDALGRLTQVIEDPNGLAYQTMYSYDVLGNLSTVTQGVQHRYFMYDSLSRLIRDKNPEQDAYAGIALSDPLSGNSQWSAAYTYDSNGNVSTRTDARGITTTYTYDNLNRNTVVDYSSGGHTNRVYDTPTNGRGRLYYSVNYPTTVANSVTVIDTYDTVGRPLYQRQHFWVNGAWSDAYVTQRSYDLAGNVTSQIYPSGRTVNYTYDIAGRTSGFTGNLGDGVSRTYAASISYDEWNGLSREQFGTDTPLYHKERRNVRGQLYDMRLSTVNDADNWNRGAIINYYSFQPVSFGGSGPDNNGNLLMQQHYVPNDDAISSSSFMQQNYGYDALNRLNWVGEFQNGTNYTGAQAQNFDQYGNRTVGGYFGTGINGQQFAVDANTNRLGVPAGQAGVMQYDANGNLANDTYSGSGSRTYDAENRMVGATNNGGLQSIYTYDAEGRRVRRNSYGQEVWQTYGIDGELLAEYAANASPSTPQKEYGYRNGQLLVTATPRTNVALSSNGAVASASSTYPSYSLPPANAINGEHQGQNYLYGGTWHSGTQSFPQWLQIDFSGSKSIDEIDVYTVQDNYTNPSEPTPSMTFSLYGLTAFDVQYWNGSSWVTVPGGSVSGNNLVWRKFTFSPVTTTKIRVMVNSTADGWSRITEVEAYSTTSNSDAIQWLVADHLGTPRMIADMTGSLAGIRRHDYLPFGEEMYAGTGARTVQQGYVADGVREQFTGYERDNETGLDYAQARYYASMQGRFTGVDPLMASAHAGNPQTWNRYAYVGNNPLGKIDPTGMVELGVDDPADEGSPAHQEQKQRKAIHEAVQAGSEQQQEIRPAPEVSNGTPKQKELIASGNAEAANRIATIEPCAALFGGKDRGLKALGSLKFIIDSALGKPEKAAELRDDGVHVNPSGAGLTLDSEVSKIEIIDPKLGGGIWVITLSGLQARAFIQLHETGHKEGRLADDRGSAGEVLSLRNNGIIWRACFGDVKPQKLD